MSYVCAIVTSPVEVGCSADRPALVHGLSGFLSNYQPPRSTSDLELSPPVTTTPCPWRIVVGRGQRINITLIDFATPRAAADVGLGCLQYAVVTERLRPPRTLRVCGGHRRRRHLHTSTSNAVDIHVTSGRHDVDADEHFYFLLHYKGQSPGIRLSFLKCTYTFLKSIFLTALFAQNYAVRKNWRSH